MAGHHHLLARQFHLGTKRDLTFSTSFTPNLNNHSHSYTVKYSIHYCPRIVNTLNSAVCIFNIIQALTFSKMHKIQRQLKLLSIQTVLVEKKSIKNSINRVWNGTSMTIHKQWHWRYCGCISCLHIPRSLHLEQREQFTGNDFMHHI